MYLQHAKATFTFGISSCDWRDDQIRILQGTNVPFCYNLFFNKNIYILQSCLVILILVNGTLSLYK